MQLKQIGWFLTIGVLPLILTACPGPGATKGVLEITVDAPSGVTPNVQVSGPGTTSTLNTTGTTTLTERDPGDYTITVNKVLAEGIGYTGSGATVKVEAGKKTSYTVSYGASSGKIRVTLAGLPAGLDAEVNIKKPDNTNLNPAPISAETVLEDIAPGTYTLEAPSRTQGSSTYASAQDGATVTVLAGEEALVNVAYTLNPGSATINVAGLDPAALPTDPVTVTLTEGSTSINRTFTANGAVNFPNLAPGAYTITANAIANNGPQDYAFTLSQTTLNVASGSTASATLTYSKPTVTVNLTGLAATANANSVIALSGPGTVAPTTITGTARSATITVPRFGSYTANATSIVAGTTVDSFYFSTSGASAAPSASDPTPSASLALTARGETGKMFITGNGTFRPDGLNVIYSVADADIATGATLTKFLPTGTFPPPPPPVVDTEGYFKTVFDREGNAYVIYQTFSGSTPARILRITEANLRAGNLTAGADGNKEIVGTAMGVTAPNRPPRVFNNEVEPADIAFDANGNMWIANDYGSAIICISNAQLNAPGSTITSFSQALIEPTSFVTSTPPVLEGTYRFVRALAFDRNGNLWFTSDDTVASDPNSRARLSRINATNLTCSGGVQRVAPDVLLNISNFGGAGGPIIKPAGLALSPDGNSLWVADYGGSTDKYRCVTPSTGDTRPVCPGNPTLVVAQTQNVDANVDQESIIQVNIAGISTNTTLRDAFADGLVVDRITIPAGSAPDRGLQQPFHMAFDKQGRLWLATNNNVIVTNEETSSPCGFTLGTGQVAVCVPSAALTDRRGKVYGLTIGSRGGSDPALPFARNVTPAVRISSAVDGVGFTGVSFNIAPANAPMYVRPNQ
jgi:hypothetical protein